MEEEENDIFDQAPPTPVPVLPLGSPTLKMASSPFASEPVDFHQKNQPPTAQNDPDFATKPKTSCSSGHNNEKCGFTETMKSAAADLSSQTEQTFRGKLTKGKDFQESSVMSKESDESFLLSFEFCHSAAKTCESPNQENANMCEYGHTYIKDSSCKNSGNKDSDAYELQVKKPTNCDMLNSPINFTSEEDPANFQILTTDASEGSDCRTRQKDSETCRTFTGIQQPGSEDISGTEDSLSNVKSQTCTEDVQETHNMPRGLETVGGGGNKDDDTQSGLEFLLSSRRKSSSVSHTRLAAFLLKYILFVLNFFFWVASVAAIVLGAWVLSERGQIVRDAASFFLDPSGMLCLLGSIIFLVAFCGCLGALRENIVLLKLFQVSMVAVLTVEAVIVLMVFAFYKMPEFRKQLKGGPEHVLTTAIRRYHDDDELRRWIDLIQREFKCCGARHSENGYRDWQLNPYFNCTSENPSVQRCGVPRSCCIIERGEYINHMCGFDTTNKERGELFGRINVQGCMKGLGQWLSAHDVAIGAVSFAIILPQIVCVVLAHMLVQHVQRQRVRWTELHSDT